MYAMQTLQMQSLSSYMHKHVSSSSYHMNNLCTVYAKILNRGIQGNIQEYALAYCEFLVYASISRVSAEIGKILQLYAIGLVLAVIMIMMLCICIYWLT